MADIMHWIHIQAPPGAVWDAITTRKGLSSWWTDDVEAEPVEGSTAAFGFGNRSVLFRMEIEVMDAPRALRWHCLGDVPEWTGTRLDFELAGDGAGTGVTFTHGGWASTQGAFRQCCTDWGRLMYQLKDYIEGRSDQPFMS